MDVTTQKALGLSVLLTLSLLTGVGGLFSGTVLAQTDTIQASPDTAGATATHTVNVTVGSNSAGSSLSNVEIDYSGGELPADVSNVGQNDITRLMLDGQDVSSDLSTVSASNNGETLTLGFGGSFSLAEGEQLVVEYANVTNPATSGSSTVNVTINPQSNPVDKSQVTVTYEPRENVQVQSVALRPSAVNASTTTTVGLQFETLNVSDDGASDEVTVTVSGDADLAAVSNLSVADATGTSVSTNSLTNSENTVTFKVTPDTAARIRNLTVSMNLTVETASVSNTGTAPIQATVDDSSTGQDSATTALTVQGPDYAITDASVTPATVHANETVTQTLTYTVTGASNDGDEDTHTITLPATTTIASINNVSVTAADGTPIGISSSASLADANDGTDNQVTFGIQPDNSIDTSAVTVDANLTVTYPSVSENTDVPVELTVADSNRDTTTATADVTVLSAAAFTVHYNVSETTVTTDEPLTITATIENTGNSTGSTTVSFNADGTTFATESVTVAAGANTTVSKTTSFSEAGAHTVTVNDLDATAISVEEPAAAAFTVSYRVNTTTVTVDDPVAVTATIANTGDAAGSTSLTFQADGEAFATHSVTVDANETTTLTETTRFSEAGAHTVTVNDLDATAISVEEPAEAVLNISYTVNDTTVTVGEPVTITATIENTGDAAGSTTVTFAANGTTVATESVTVAAGASTTVSKTIRFSEASPHAVTVNDLEQTTITVQNLRTASITFDNQTVQAGTETVTVANANYTLADGTAGEYVIVVCEVYDNGTHSAPVGYSAPQTGSTDDISVDLNVSASQNDSVDAIQENITLHAGLHTPAQTGFGEPIQQDGHPITDEARITVTDEPLFVDPIPGTNAAAPPTDLDNDGLYEDVNGDGEATFADAVALAFAEPTTLT